MNDPNLLINDGKKKMENSIKALQVTLSKIRSGRASTNIVEDIKVNIYGQSMLLNQLATITIPEARSITIDTWDKGNISLLEQAIHNSGRNLNPNIDGGLIRINLPELTEESRKELAKLSKQKLEDHKVSIRNIRRDINDSLKKIKNDMSEDDFHKYQQEVQKMTDDNIVKSDEIQIKKEKEIMTI